MSTVTIETKSKSTTSIAPSNKLENADGKAFILFGKDWLKLQSFITTCLKMPITKTDFTNRYGNFSDEQMIEDCVSAMQQVQAMGALMGDPTTLRHNIQTNPNYLSGKTPPKGLFAHCAWMAGRLSTHASTYNSNLSVLKDFMTNKPKENKKVLADIMSPTSGLQATAKRGLKEIQHLQKKLTSFETSFNSAKSAITTYVDEDSSVIAAAKAAEKVDTTKIASLQKSATAAHKAFEGLTIAEAALTAVAFLSLGILIPVAIAADGVLGKLANAEKEKYNDLMSEIGTDKVELSQKTRLVTDLTSFNKTLSGIGTLLSGFKTSLEKIEGVWTNQNIAITNIMNLPYSKIGSYKELKEAIHLTTALTDWTTMASNTGEFVTDAMISYSTSTQYPSQYS
ncbi:hypothetical protein [Roseivirga sp. E12]|uniref:hypothetical protein n=1 Tax=Roseivirga sp. E12 TaxID=2819237 RepID=UPI001ABD2371|nr:hypothetical protein [Roseivirga sp. E12]MBO3698077.1 hypothetical protein [Roseivirga sp. E12]